MNAPLPTQHVLQAATPEVSVVIPTMGRPQMLRRCLNALLEQQPESRRYEIIVANDRPDHGTEAVVHELRCTHPQGPTLLYLPIRDGTGPAHARNTGWRNATAPLIAFTDDDTIPSRQWLAEGLQRLHIDGADAASGYVRVPLGPKPTDYERDAAGLERAEFVTANCFLRREALERVGGFDERYKSAWREDSDLQFNLMQQGLKLTRAPQAIVLHPVRPAGFGVSLRQQRKVMFDALLYRKHPQLYRQRIRANPRYDYYLIVALLVAGFAFASAGMALPASVALAAWSLLTLRFTVQRLRGTSHAPRHVLEMLLTSVLIPPLALYWRLVGNLRFRTVLL